ncbi:bifunctional phosphopantothenoylcysteine decarboxylase/phosphopantothenate--cysteine ligase CoaBC [Kaistia geumhonensis]|uniref:Coenzyme A biosynthesis bifunctional protein CoaBC n=1 Tax=Kaistia geumhonensis TaxID=410839 RepID=A0ABU0M6N4_9HYPH|nr:bifunctional phosphopantothenoylcysteine decarboxylase/phosphopantothenate--cysteine ligase CoaBC [Kaistia geumhonensis]MCX5478163.1 bifunctional phosphopantothenoylcysteine decarboxylase/phosphopantothenate--cysteine ligase CoaBC [Kaistia geumhonensis]MDQ0516621.1 phosphopantothenoylcysteine decarboxylase/phosphopantothenate--cysteine ligase [Kaistia geumhonensis]
MMESSPLGGRAVLLVIGGGIAAYKALDLIRRLKERGAAVTVVMTAAAQQFVTPLAAGALAGGRVHTDLFDREAEHDIGHIRLARAADLVILAPATADRLARMATGLGDDLAGAVLLAARAKVLAAPAMNPAMWSHPATRRNVEQLTADGVAFVGPEAGEMAESGEAGLGRMSEPLAIVAAAEAMLEPGARRLAGRHVLVTAGPTHEPIDPVRYIANRSSGRQGFAIATAAAAEGARVTLVHGPVAIAPPRGVKAVSVETAREMLAAAEAALPADIAVFAAAVADWRPVAEAAGKIKKDGSGSVPALALAENPDILAAIAHRAEGRPGLVVGFAAETDDLLAHAGAKLARKGADVIVANDVSPGTGIMGGAENEVVLVTTGGTERWPRLGKDEVARRLVHWMADHLPEPRP